MITRLTVFVLIGAILVFTTPVNTVKSQMISTSYNLELFDDSGNPLGEFVIADQQILAKASFPDSSTHGVAFRWIAPDSVVNLAGGWCLDGCSPSVPHYSSFRPDIGGHWIVEAIFINTTFDINNPPLSGPEVLAKLSAEFNVVVVCGGKEATIVGTRGDDTIEGTPEDDVITGLKGNDAIDGRGGKDTICGGFGDDVIQGGDGNDRIIGQAGSDEIQGDGGNDRIYGKGGNDRIYGGNGNDRIYGGNGNHDFLFGEAGDDMINGNAGNDDIDGGDGTDICSLGGGSRRDSKQINCES
ncbi:MAG: hypothetical protein HMLIMOIP_000548 [Candidatus Nitrosomirales archaeon]